MSCKVEKKRRQEKYTTTTGDRATVPTQSDVCDFTESTAIMKGEWYINFADGTIENRHNSGIGQVPFVTPTASDDGKATVYDHTNKKFILSEVAVNLNILGSVYLVSENGDNDTAVAGDLSKPWADPWAARDAWVTGGSIGRVVILPGSYTIPVAYTDTDTNASLLRDGIVIAGLPGVEIITDTAKSQFYDVTGMTTKIYGQIIFRNTAGDETNWFHNIYVTHTDANHDWTFDLIEVEAFIGYQTAGTIRTRGRLESVRAGQLRWRPNSANTEWFHYGDISATTMGRDGGDPDTLATWWQIGQIRCDAGSSNCRFEHRGNGYHYGWGGSNFAGVAWLFFDNSGVDNSGNTAYVRGDYYCEFITGAAKTQRAVMVGMLDDTYFEGNIIAPGFKAVWGVYSDIPRATNKLKVKIPHYTIKGAEDSQSGALALDGARTASKIDFESHGTVTDGYGYNLGDWSLTNGCVIKGDCTIQMNNIRCFNITGTNQVNIQDLKIIMPSGTTGNVFEGVAGGDVYSNGVYMSNNTNRTDVNVTFSGSTLIHENANVK